MNRKIKLSTHSRTGQSQLWMEINSKIRRPPYKQFSFAEMLKHERAQLMLIPTVLDGNFERSCSVLTPSLKAVTCNPCSINCLKYQNR